MSFCTSHANSPGRLCLPPLAVLLRAEAGGPALAVEPVQPADLLDAVGEAWREQCLRKGFPENPLGETPVSLVPLPGHGNAAARYRGFSLEVTLPDGRVSQQQFGLGALRTAADRAAESLVERGVLSRNSSFVFELVLDETLPRPALGADQPFSVAKMKSAPLSCRKERLAPLLERARPVEQPARADFPVFFTAEALRRAEQCSRAGASAVPPVESGGVLVGSLACCDVEQEWFVIVTDVLEVHEPEQTEFTLAYSGRSWSRIQKILAAKQVRDPGRLVRLVGQAHGHNFLPNLQNQCDLCEKLTVCGQTSVFVSRDDRDWMRAVFAHQPWALCQIYGLTARREPVHQLFSLKDASWQPRGYYVLPEFNWNEKALPPAPSQAQAIHTHEPAH
jgi:hypothetical protein